MKSLLNKIDNLVAECLGSYQLSLSTSQIQTLEKEIFWILHSSAKQSKLQLGWYLKYLERHIISVHRTCRNASGVSSKKVLILLLNLYDGIVKCFDDIPDDLELLVLSLRKYKKPFNVFNVRFCDFLTESQLTEELTHFAIIPLKYFHQSLPSDKFEYWKYLYLKEYMIAFEQIIGLPGRYSCNERKLMYKLIELNLNRVEIYEYICKDIKEKYVDVSDLAGLKQMKRDLKALFGENGMSFDPRYRSLKSSIVKYLSKEIKLLKEREFFASLKRSALKLKMPVPQIACFAQLLHRQGLFYETDKKKIAEHFVDVFSSKETDRISKGSFLNHFKRFSDPAGRSVSTLLRKMLDDLDQNFL